MGKPIIALHGDVRKSLQKGIQKLSSAVKTTMGPSGRLVLIDRKAQAGHLTKDGVTVAKHVRLTDPIENQGARLIREAADKVVSIAGDGTTSVTTFASFLVDKGMEGVELGINPVGIKKGMLLAQEEAVLYLKDLAVGISGNDDLEDVATISANGDVSIGHIITSAMNEVGSDGVVVIEESRSDTTRFEMIEGMEIAKGYINQYFATDQSKMLTMMTKAKVLLVNYILDDLSKPFLDLLQAVSERGDNLVIIAENYSELVLSTLVLNKTRGALKVCCVKAPEFGDRRTSVMHDIAILTGATVLDKTKNLTFNNFEFEWLGTAGKVTIDRDTTVFVDGGGSEESMVERTNNIKDQIDNATTDYDREHLQQRLSRLLGGVAVIHVGGINESDMLERKDRFEDALSATKAALQEGIVPGGGVAYLRIAEKLNTPTKLPASEKYGYEIVKEGLSIFFKTILGNAGYSLDEVIRSLVAVSNSKNIWSGVDIESKKVINYKDDGIIDPAKVVRAVISTGVNVAANILLIECIITEEDEPAVQALPEF